MFSRTWLAVLAGSFVVWGMNQIGAGPSLPASGTGGAGQVRPLGSSPAAAAAVPGLAACLDEVASLDAAASSGSGVQEAPSVERRYRERCRPGLDGAGFGAFAIAYGERSRAAVAAILDREERLAAELVAGPQAAVLDSDVVWAAALTRAASDVRAFDDELAAWFDARAPSSGAAVSVGAPDAAGAKARAGAPAR